MSAIAIAPDRSVPEPPVDGTTRERWVLRLVRSTPAPPRRISSQAHLTETWNRALEASEKGLNAAEATKAYVGPELFCRRQRLGEERRWLARLEELGPYDPLPDFVDPRRDARPTSRGTVRTDEFSDRCRSYL